MLASFTPVAVSIAIPISIAVGVDLAVGSVTVAKIAMRHVKLLPCS
jgi:hypothetical protein